MKRQWLTAAVMMGISLAPGQRVKADVFGADVAVLGQILQQTILQLNELKGVMQSGKDTLGLIEEINRGINDSLRMADTLGLRIDPGLYRNLKQVDKTVAAMEKIYGKTC